MAVPHKAITLSQKGLILLALPLMFEMFTFSVLYWASESAEKDVKQESYARAITQHVNTIIKLVMEAGSAVYMYSVGGKSEQLQRYRRATELIPEEFKTLHTLLAPNAGEAEALTNIEAVVGRVLTCLDEARSAARSRDIGAALNYLSQVKSLSEKASLDMEALSAPYHRLEKSSSEQAARIRRYIKLALGLAVLISALLVIALYVYFDRNTARRLSVIVENTIRFAKGEQLLPTLSGGDELAHLDDAFHNMTETITMQAREKQEFMAMISHDIRSPLTSVFGSMALLIEPRMGFNLPSEALNIVHRSQNNIDRLMRLINDLLDIEKFESGKMKMVYEITPMAYVIEQSVQALKTLADQKEIKLSATETNAEVFADGDRLVQVLVNLLSNALKYSPDNSTIKIAATEESSWLIVSVIDQGPGIPADYKDKMFQRFQQVDVAERRKYGGTGLGLAVCKEIVAAHNGTIGIDSEEGHGSTFWFRIPKNEETMLAAGNGQLEMQMKTG